MKDQTLQKAWHRRLSWRVVLLFMWLAVQVPAFAQTVNLSGQVTDESGEPVIGASVIIQGTQLGVATDFDGNYSIPNAPALGTLKVTYIGYLPQTISINGQSVINVVMQEDAQTLDEVVVVGYGTMKKNDVTGSVSTVGTEKLNAKGAASVLEGLQGTVAGVNITKSTGRSNGDINIEIRGKSSINSNTKPIYVVDGVICSDIDFLNPQDIERIDVLKDASSTAIYGSRATAGVVMVTTKGALAVNREQAPSISYDGYFGIAKAAHLPDFMTGAEFYQYRFKKFGESINAIAGETQMLTPQTIYGYKRGQMGIGQALLQKSAADPFSPYVMKQMVAEGRTYDWPDLVLRDGVQQNHYVSINGGSKAATYNFGVGINDERGLYRGDESTTFSFKGSLDVRVNKVISAGFNLNAAYMNQGYANDDAISHAYYMNPFMIPYNAEGQINHNPGNYITLGSDQAFQFSDSVSPLDLLLNTSKNRKSYRLLGNVYLKLDIIKGLDFKTTFSPTYSSYREGNFAGYENPNSPGKTYAGGDLDTSTASAKNYTSLGWIWDNMINYNVTIAEDHSINAMGLISAEKSQSETYEIASTHPLANSDWYNLGSGEINGTNTKSSFGQSSMLSYALRLNYGYKSRYLITATMRWDGASKLADGYRWTSFPSLALAWRLSEESFIKKLDWVSNGKLRFSYGVTGNNTGISAYQSLVGVGGPVYYPFLGTYTPGFYANGIVDKTLTWETSKEFNVGLDFGFLNNRISGTFDWYVKNSRDLLFPVKLPLEAGGIEMKTNIGKVRNTGVELSLTTVNVETNDWNWQTTFTFAHNSNKVKEINGVSDKYVNGATGSLFVGSSVNNIYNYVWDGVVSDKNMVVPDTEIARAKGFTPGQVVPEYDYYFTCYGLSEGRAIVRDVNGDGNIDENDKVILNRDPKWTGSLTSNLSYRLPGKGGMVDFSFSLYTRQGSRAYSPFMDGDLFKTSDRGWNKVMVDYYIPAGVLIDCDGMNDDGTYINPVYQTETHYGSWPFPNATDNDGVGSSISPVGNWNEARKTVNDSFVKVKNISVGYSFHKSLLKHIGCQYARIYVNITNPFVWTKYKGFDPEWANASTKNDGPSTVTYQVGASIKF